MSYAAARPASRRNLLPAAGAWAAVLGDSISDHTIPYAQWFDMVCAYFGYKPINTTIVGNGSYEADTTDTANDANGSLPWTLSAVTAASAGVAPFHGARVLKAVSNATAGAQFFNVGGNAPATLSATATGGVVQPTVAASYSGGGYVASTLTTTGGGATTQATYALAVNSAGAIVAVKVLTGGAGYTGQPTFAATDGTGAVFTATIVGGAITAVATTAGGAGYRPSPAVYVAGGAGASLVAYIDAGGACQGAFVAAGGTGYPASPATVVATMRPYSRAYETTLCQAGASYLLTARVWSPTTGGVPPNSVYLQVVMQDTTGAFTVVASAPLSGQTAGNWFPVSVQFTVPGAAPPANIVATYFRLGATTTGAGQIMYVDGVQIQGPLPAGVAMTTPPAYTDYTERGGIGGSTAANLSAGVLATLGTAITNSYPAILAAGNGIGGGVSSFTGANGGVGAGQSTVANRVAKHAATGVVFVAYGVNDLMYMSGSYGANATTAASFAAGLDAIYAAIAAMSPAPVVVALGIANFGVGGMNPTPPAGYADYYQAADALEEIIRQKAAANGALYAAIRRRMDIGMVLANGPHPLVPQGHRVMADAVIRAIEEGR